MTPAQQSDVKFARRMAWCNAAIPGVLLLWDAAHHKLGANPVNFAILTTGLCSLIFLLLSLLVTPLARLSGLNWLVNFRRLLGLYGFFYAAAHFGIFVVYDRAGSLSSTLHEIVARRYLWFGAGALTLLIPLAATSTAGMIRRLGPKRWKRLHRLTYVIAIAACVHYYMQTKADTRQPTAFAASLGVLLGYRAVQARRNRESMHRKRMTSTSRGLSAKRPVFWRGELEVISVRDETPEVRTLRFARIGGGKLPFEFLPGQYLNLVLNIDGQKVSRSYTIASSPSREDSCELTVKREERGLSSRHLHHQIKVGDRLNISAPAGKFTFAGMDEPGIVLIAGGVGITPLMSKIRFLTDRKWRGEIHLFFAVRTRADIIFRQELDELQRKHPNLHITITLTRDNGSEWHGARGRIDTDLLLRTAPMLRELPVHLCGPDEMVMDLIAKLKDVGVPSEHIAYESFTPLTRKPQAKTPAAEGTPIDTTLTFMQSNESTQIMAEQTILEAAEAIGVSIDYDCRAGICGTCKVKLCSGSVKMDVEDALTEQDRMDKLILACQARCLEPAEVDV